MPKLKSDWDFFWSLLESQRLRGSGSQLTADQFLIVIVQGPDAHVPSIKDRIRLDMIKDAREIIVSNLDYEGVDNIVNELNYSDKIAYILLCHMGEKNYISNLVQGLKWSNKLLRKNRIPKIIDLPTNTTSSVRN